MMRTVVDFEDALEEFRSGQHVEPEPVPFADVLALATLTEVLADVLHLDAAAAHTKAVEQLRKHAVARLATWTPTGRGH